MGDLTVGIVGAGAVGTILAGALSTNSQPFHWVERSPARLSQLHSPELYIASDILRLDPDSFTLHSSVTVLPDGLDVLFVAVKSFQVEQVLSELGSSFKNVVVVANGLLQGDYHLGLLYGGGSICADGSTRIMADNSLYIGPLATTVGPLGGIPALLTTSWLHCELVSNIRPRMFHKLALNCVINPLTAILDCANGLILRDEILPLMRDILAEINAVASCELGESWNYDIDGLYSDCLSLIERTATNSSSMREDVRSGRETELVTLNQAVVELGKAHGLDCPCNMYMGNMLSLLANRKAM